MVSSQPGLLSAVEVHDPNVPISDEGDPGAVRRPGRKFVSEAVVGQPSQATAVRIHHIDLKITVPVGRKGDSGDRLRGGRFHHYSTKADVSP
jgi:hypothetical protein